MPVALAIVALLALLVVSYRQVVDAYPSAGGAYVVSRDNFGNVTAVAGAALLIDYVLTVAVSVSSGVAAMSSVWDPTSWAAPGRDLGRLRVLLAWGNLRGIREARAGSSPSHLRVRGRRRRHDRGRRLAAVQRRLGPITYSRREAAQLHHADAVGAVTVFLLLRAFASGTTALTGVEAISNGVSAFRAPEAVNAKKTLMVMAAIMELFLGITYLAVQLDALPFEWLPDRHLQIARQVLERAGVPPGPGGDPAHPGARLGYRLLRDSRCWPASPRRRHRCRRLASGATASSTPTGSSPCRRWQSS